MSRGLVAVSAAGAAVIHIAAAATGADRVGVALALVGVAELTIAAGAAVGARWLPSTRSLVLILVTPVLLWATLLLVAITADTPSLASALATVPLAGASVLGLAGAISAGADARRVRVGARVRPAGAVIAVATGALLTALVVTPSVAATLPHDASPLVGPTEPPTISGDEPAQRIVFGDHTGHLGDQP